jgi:hypothetical protein
MKPKYDMSLSLKTNRAFLVKKTDELCFLNSSNISQSQPIPVVNYLVLMTYRSNI